MHVSTGVVANLERVDHDSQFLLKFRIPVTGLDARYFRKTGVTFFVVFLNA
jgi:hypothetical protein